MSDSEDQHFVANDIGKSIGEATKTVGSHAIRTYPQGPGHRSFRDQLRRRDDGILELIAEARLLAVVPRCRVGEIISGVGMEDEWCAHLE